MEETKKPITIDISYHFMVRIVERVHRVIHLNEQQMRDHVRNNKLSLMEQSLYMFGISEFLWQGALSEKFPVANFFICEHGTDNRRYVIITDSSQTNLITIYPIEFINLPTFLAKTLENKLVSRWFRLQERQKQVIDRSRPVIQYRRNRIAAAKERIRQLEERIQYQRERIESHQAALKCEEKVIDKIRDDRGEIAKLLCNSAHVSSDLFGWKKIKA